MVVVSEKEFMIPKVEDVLKGKTTDIYFVRVMEILEKDGKNPYVVMQVMVKDFPDLNYNFAVLSGTYRVASLLKGKSVNIYSMREGEIFFEGEPIMWIEGYYRDFGIYENSILGFLSKSTGISTKAARVSLAAKHKTVFEFGTRRTDPFLAGIVSYAARIGGFSGLSNIAGAEMLNCEPVGTMPHLLMLIYGSTEAGFKAFDKYLTNVPRVALIDTFEEPDEEVKIALKVFDGRLEGVRIDSGDLKKHAETVKKILKERGYGNVKLFASGRLDEYKISELVDLYDGFGVGTAIADAPSLDFSLKPVEIDGKAVAKRGYLTGAGAKQVYRKNWIDTIVPKDRKIEGEPLIRPLLINGKIVEKQNLENTIDFTRKRLESMPKELKNLTAKTASRIRYGPNKIIFRRK